MDPFKRGVKAKTLKLHVDSERVYMITLCNFTETLMTSNHGPRIMFIVVYSNELYMFVVFMMSNQWFILIFQNLYKITTSYNFSIFNIYNCVLPFLFLQKAKFNTLVFLKYISLLTEDKCFNMWIVESILSNVRKLDLVQIVPI